MTTTPPDDPTSDPEPEEPTERIIKRLDRLIDATMSGTAAVSTERRWRRLSFVLLFVIVAGLGLLGADRFHNEHQDRLRSEHATCVDRRDRTEENRKVQARVAAYEATFYGRPKAERDRLAAGVAKIVVGSLPLPTC